MRGMGTRMAVGGLYAVGWVVGNPMPYLGHSLHDQALHIARWAMQGMNWVWRGGDAARWVVGILVGINNARGAADTARQVMGVPVGVNDMEGVQTQ